jgi:hypothetical protein
MAYFMSNTSASASEDIAAEPENDEDDEGTVLKVPLRPLLNSGLQEGIRAAGDLR